MKMAQVMSLIKSKPDKKAGYLVHFYRAERGLLFSDYFPEKGEPPIPTEEKAWKLAEQFAAKTRGQFVHIYVVRRADFMPVPGYRTRLIENR